MIYFLKRVILVVFFITFSHLTPTGASDADDLAEEAKNFCQKTPTGKSYSSFEGCMDYQLEGALLLIKAIQAGYEDIVTECMGGAKYDGYADFAAASLCVIIKEPSLLK